MGYIKAPQLQENKRKKEKEEREREPWIMFPLFFLISFFAKERPKFIAHSLGYCK